VKQQVIQSKRGAVGPIDDKPAAKFTVYYAKKFTKEMAKES